MSSTTAESSAALPPKALIIAWIALPQIAETILAPALPNIARVWQLDPAHTQWVMGIFFLGFSAGVLLWGQVCDRWGRRPALLLGLLLALAGTALAALAPGYPVLLAGRFVQALGMATCSVTTQTILRDRLDAKSLTRYFVTLGMVLSWSPALGPLTGQWLTDAHGYRGVFAAVGVLLLVLFACAARWLDETRPATAVTVPMMRLIPRMARDGALWRAAVLVAGLNALVFSFYAAGPFMVGHLPGLGFGWAGLGVAVAGSLGAAINRHLPERIVPEQRIRYALVCVLAGVAAQLLFGLASGHAGLFWAIAALPVFVGFGLAIPNVLGSALRNYGDCLGRAGALFGVTYYLMLGAALAATSAVPFDSPVPLSLCWTLVAIALLAVQRMGNGLASVSANGLRP